MSHHDELTVGEIDALVNVLYCGDASTDEQDAAARIIERSREIARAVYVNWACGEPGDEAMMELGKTLGFKADVL